MIKIYKKAFALFILVILTIVAVQSYSINPKNYDINVTLLPDSNSDVKLNEGVPLLISVTEDGEDILSWQRGTLKLQVSVDSGDISKTGNVSRKKVMTFDAQNATEMIWYPVEQDTKIKMKLKSYFRVLKEYEVSISSFDGIVSEK